RDTQGLERGLYLFDVIWLQLRLVIYNAEVVTQVVLVNLAVGLKDELLKDLGCDEKVPSLFWDFISLFPRKTFEDWKVSNKITGSLAALRMISKKSSMFLGVEKTTEVDQLNKWEERRRRYAERKGKLKMGDAGRRLGSMGDTVDSSILPASMPLLPEEFRKDSVTAMTWNGLVAVTERDTQGLERGLYLFDVIWLQLRLVIYNAEVVPQVVLVNLAVGLKDELLKDLGCDEKIPSLFWDFISLFPRKTFEDWKVSNKITGSLAALRTLRISFSVRSIWLVCGTTPARQLLRRRPDSRYK
ncbi:hypothetical protein QYM36_007741, partial [Artemia franciscana]